MLQIILNRRKSNAHETWGELYLNGKRICYTLEDEKRAVKVWGETRIPAGEYEIKLRKEGGHHARYTKFDFHKGMLHLQNVPNFKWILIHIGNNDKDTAGCILVGSVLISKNGRFTLLRSTDAYIAIYPQIANALERGEKATITIKDEN
jgi:hypothetical protein